MNDGQSTRQPTRGGLTSGVLILLLGAFEVAIIYGLLALDGPIAQWARGAAESWAGRFLLAAIGLAIIIVTMIVLLTILERRQAGRSTR